MEYQKPRRPNWGDLERKPNPDPPKINRDIHDIFTTPTGKRVMQWLFDKYVVSQEPMNASERAWIEAEGKKRMVLELVTKIEDHKRDITRRANSTAEQPTTD